MAKTQSMADELIAGFSELADALEKGDDIGAQFTCYQIELDLQPQKYTPELVAKTRKQLGASQVVFAKFLGVSANAVRQWEQGRAVPMPIACRFMDEIRRDPNHYIARLRESVVAKRGRAR